LKQKEKFNEYIPTFMATYFQELFWIINSKCISAEGTPEFWQNEAG
jgi:hypothetical protein